MAFFTPYYKKSSQFIGWFLLGCACLAWAATSSLNIKTAELVLVEDAYLLNADIETVFSDQIEDAINKGVPLNFLVEFQLVAPRKYWFDDEIVTATSEVTLSYHALSRQYLFQRNGHQHSFISLQEVKTEFSKIYADIFVRLGILKSDSFIEIKKDDLVAKYLGQTSHRTKKLLESGLLKTEYLHDKLQYLYILIILIFRITRL
jgi:hypothetical protein